MPTYAYACTVCGHRFEQHQSFSDAALTTCPVCEGRLRKLFSSVGVVFKGSGFYRTDSRSGSTSRSSTLPSVPAGETAGSGGSGSTDSGSAGAAKREPTTASAPAGTSGASR